MTEPTILIGSMPNGSKSTPTVISPPDRRFTGAAADVESGAELTGVAAVDVVDSPSVAPLIGATVLAALVAEAAVVVVVDAESLSEPHAPSTIPAVTNTASIVLGDGDRVARYAKNT